MLLLPSQIPQLLPSGSPGPSATAGLLEREKGSSGRSDECPRIAVPVTLNGLGRVRRPQLILTYRNGKFDLELPRLNNWLPLQEWADWKIPRPADICQRASLCGRRCCHPQPVQSQVTPFRNHR